MGWMASKPQTARPLEPDPWVRAEVSREDVARALLAGGMAGVVSHDRPNVIWKLSRLCEGDEDSQFGLTGVDELAFEEVLRLMAQAGGIDADPTVRHGVVRVDPEVLIERLELAGDRLAEAARAGARIVLATGHPDGPNILYAAVGRLMEEHGAEVITPAEGRDFKHRGRRRRIDYADRVAVMSNGVRGVHTHSPHAMEMILAADRPDLVLADHGFAGAAIEAGVDTVSVADVNDPALVVAEAKGRGGPVIVMDDNVEPEDYWPCFQVIASRFA
jgi:hypothetical protein